MKLQRAFAAALAIGCAWGLESARAQYAWDPPPEKVVVLAINSHPDDEGIFFGGLLPYYSAILEVPTVLVSMTSGDWNPANLTVREAEMRCAAWNYGLRYEPIFGRFRDVPSHNMSTNPYANKIDATWDYWADGVLQGDGQDVEAGKLKAINYVAEQIRRHRPEIIITHDTAGEYGHHNHIATCQAVTNAFYVAADPNATAPNLAGLAPWQAKKLYIHLYPQNRLFHRFLELPAANLAHRTARQAADTGLDCHVSQRQPDVSTVYRAGENYDPYPSEWWGLYASTVGPDTPLSEPFNAEGFVVPAGAACGNLLENILDPPTTDPVFFEEIQLPVAMAGFDYSVSLLPWLNYPGVFWGQTVTFSKVSGPEWLQVSPEGRLSGTPGEGDLGSRLCVFRVVGSDGLQDEVSVPIQVESHFPVIHDLAAWWKLDETSGAQCADSSPHYQNGTYIGAVSLGQPGASITTAGAVMFNGVDAKVEVPYSEALNPDTFTVAAWVNPARTYSAYGSVLTSREIGPQSGYILYAGQNNTWQFWLGTGSAWRVLAGGTIKSGTWVHLTGTYDGSTARFYTNGILAASAQTAFRPNARFPLRIGTGGTEGADQYWFQGRIDDVRLYRGAFSQEQVLALVSNQPPIFLSNPAPATAWAGTAFSVALPGAQDPEAGGLSFGKVSGPEWLRVSANGTAYGVPASSDVGPNHFQVAVADMQGALDVAGLDVYVLPGRAPVFSAVNTLNYPAVRLNVSAPEGQRYVIESAPSPQGPWEAIGTNSVGISLFEWTDANESQAPVKFYRAVIP